MPFRRKRKLERVQEFPAIVLGAAIMNMFAALFINGMA